MAGRNANSGPKVSVPLQTVRLPRPRLTTEVWVKFAAAWFSLASGGWLWVVATHLLPRVMAAAAMIFGLLWLHRFVRARRADRRDDPDVLELTPENVALRSAGTRTVVSWHEVCRIEQDQDALMVCVVRKDGTEWRLDPEYGGLGLDALSQLLHQFLLQSRGCADPDRG